VRMQIDSDASPACEVLQIKRCGDEDDGGGDDDNIIIARCGRRRWCWARILSCNTAPHSLLSGSVSTINHAPRGGNGNFARTRGVGPSEG
jgi:hypothetical protein